MKRLVAWSLAIGTLIASITTTAIFVVRHKNARSASSHLVDLGYAIYRGHDNLANGLHEWRGIRYAAPPIGNLRWQAPRVPHGLWGPIIDATATPFQCPQAPHAMGALAMKKASPPIFNQSNTSEDCLFLNVISPPDAKDLPVFVWIHGGGYGAGNADFTVELGKLINANKQGFVAVVIQYRLGVFGFLASNDVDQYGAVNAGLLDQNFALEWVHKYIHLFGGNASEVTIGGASAGAGSVMLQTMAFNGSLGTSLFRNAIAMSPYLPFQYDFNATQPTDLYYAFAKKTGCLPETGRPTAPNRSIFDCLISRPTEVLANANMNISMSGPFGTWAFLPVTDRRMIQSAPSLQLRPDMNVNGLQLLTSNVADEGAAFTPQNITSEARLREYLQIMFPLLSSKDIDKVLTTYPGDDSNSTRRFATWGDSGPTAVAQSSYATGFQQRANNIFAEVTIDCPSYWLAEAYSGQNRSGWKYQYSLPGSTHGADATAITGGMGDSINAALDKALMNIWGNFIIHSNPTIPLSTVAPHTYRKTVNQPTTTSAASSNSSSSMFPWPALRADNGHAMLNINLTGGHEVFVPSGIDWLEVDLNITQMVGPGLRNQWRIVDAQAWEGGRGKRCDFWREMGAKVPER